jgi:hypothetical protein
MAASRTRLTVAGLALSFCSAAPFAPNHDRGSDSYRLCHDSVPPSEISGTLKITSLPWNPEHPIATNVSSDSSERPEHRNAAGAARGTRYSESPAPWRFGCRCQQLGERAGVGGRGVNPDEELHVASSQTSPCAV